MEKIVLDEALRAKLNGLTRQIEVCDPSGERIGIFVPAADYQALVAAAFAQAGGRPGHDVTDPILAVEVLN